jgi:hypothetical protein
MQAIEGSAMFVCHAQGSFLEDVQRLHIPTLTWRPPPRESGRPSRALRRIAGHSFAGLLAFGGCIPTIMGIMPVEKLDLMLLGKHTGHRSLAHSLACCRAVMPCKDGFIFCMAGSMYSAFRYTLMFDMP